MRGRNVVFSHGLESGPWGDKISAMADVARSEGFEVESVDYRGITDPGDRVTRLLSYCRDLQGDLVLVGSSMGGHVAATASALLRAQGMFLLAPAFYMPGHEDLTPKPAKCPTTIVHGWRDDVVPVENSIRYAREHGATLHILDGDHRLHEQIAQINYLFEYFLVDLDRPKMRGRG
ncbi:MAG: alpha/beta fold hydrolase [Steroidobacteraceae bacterium]|mgnify:CR=1 FL=1|nr:alpha/beta fold hydrolase [Steroidobacteraceae bacterium]MCC7199778.1 alpha/beta fold hydrolase [Gammaproteobacteria bacterium]